MAIPISLFWKILDWMLPRIITMNTVPLMLVLDSQRFPNVGVGQYLTGLNL